MLRKINTILFLLRSDHRHNSGGDVVQAKTTAAEFRRRGYVVDILAFNEVRDWKKYDLIQVFNLGRPAEIIPVFSHGIPVYLFSIWVDFYELDLRFRRGFIRFVARASGRFGWEYIKVLGRWLRRQTPFPGWRYVFLGHKKSMQYVLNRVHAAFASTHHEWNRIEQYFDVEIEKSVIPLGVNVPTYHDNPVVESDSICFAGYIEPRKGVLELIRVCNRRGWILHVFGRPSAGNASYAQKCEQEAGPTVFFHGHCPQEEYHEKLRTCRVVALPSWFETTGLSALEAAFLGKSVVVGDGGDTREVFRDFAFYAKPGDENALEQAIEQAMNYQQDQRAVEHFRAFGMTQHADALISQYKKIRVLIMGTRGVPNRYGGFEALAEALAVHHSGYSVDLSILQPRDHPFSESYFEGARLVRVSNPENVLGTFGQFFYDLFGILEARKRRFDVWLHLGYTSNTLWWFLWSKKAVQVSNMDGLEWKRSKYSKFVRLFLRWAERKAAELSDYLIADHPAIAQYLRETYQRNSSIIAYGADAVRPADFSSVDHLEKYDMLMARMEPENHVHTILEAHTQVDNAPPIIVLGGISNAYARKLQKDFPESSRVLWLGGIYDQGVVERLRRGARYYFHGHSVGGTNPSLVQAMASGCTIVAHDNVFNRGVLGDKAQMYFKTSAELKDFLSQNRAVTKVDYQGLFSDWNTIAEAYFQLFAEVCTPRVRER